MCVCLHSTPLHPRRTCAYSTTARSFLEAGTRPATRPAMGRPERPSTASSSGRPAEDTRSPGNAAMGCRRRQPLSQRRRKAASAGVKCVPQGASGAAAAAVGQLGAFGAGAAEALSL